MLSPPEVTCSCTTTTLATTDVLPPLQVMHEWRRVALGAFSAAGRDIHLGHRLPTLFIEAGIGLPDDTDVAGRLSTMSTGGDMAVAVSRSLLPGAVAFGLTTTEDGNRWVQDFTRAMQEHPDHAVLWPLMIGAWKHKPETVNAQWNPGGGATPAATPCPDAPHPVGAGDGQDAS